MPRANVYEISFVHLQHAQHNVSHAHQPITAPRRLAAANQIEANVEDERAHALGDQGVRGKGHGAPHGGDQINQRRRHVSPLGGDASQVAVVVVDESGVALLVGDVAQPRQPGQFVAHLVAGAADPDRARHHLVEKYLAGHKKYKNEIKITNI